MLPRDRRPATSTSRFGAGRREGHDASKFYEQFDGDSLPSIDPDDTVHPPFECTLEKALQVGDSRRIADFLPARSVALVVTSPPYFAAKAYEEARGEGHIPASYVDYLQMLTDVFDACWEVLEPGGRIAVNVANLGRRPFRSLSADVTRILERRYLLRGEIVWQKAVGASGSCAWGSFGSPANPVLRDTTERVIVASKGRFDRARNQTQRRREGLPAEVGWLSRDEFMDATLDVWQLAPESARRVKHPAPFPIELPMRLIDLYTYENDLVLDPFLGSGSTAVAAALRKRRYAGLDTDPAYVELARERVRREVVPELFDRGSDPQAKATAAKLASAALAERALIDAGFRIVDRGRRLPKVGLSVPVVVADRTDAAWFVDTVGAFSATSPGLDRMDAVWRVLGRAEVLASTLASSRLPLLVLTSRLPRRGSSVGRALRSAGTSRLFDVVEPFDDAALARLHSYAHSGWTETLVAQPGFWTPAEISASRPPT